MATTSLSTPIRKRDAKMLSRSRGKLVVVSAATLICLYLCYRIVQPFLPALVWAVTAAVITQPVVRWIGRWIRSPTWRSLAAVSLVFVTLFAPLACLLYFAAVQVVESLQHLQETDFLAGWNAMLSQHPRFAASWNHLAQTLELDVAMSQLLQSIHVGALAVVSGSAYTLGQAVLTLFILFFLYRDEGRVVANVRWLLPLNNRETDRLLERLDDTIHATIFGTVAVALIQGAMGGLMFAILGLPSPALWGTVMGLLAIIPYLGTFVVWAPTAVLLALGGDWVSAAVLVGWGMIAIGLIDNLLYPYLVGNRLQQHTVIAFLAIVGGIAVFGATGVILGPVVVSLTLFLLEFWRQHTATESAAKT